MGGVLVSEGRLSPRCTTLFFDLEKATMTRIRPTRQRTAGFEVLEGRWALSAGLAVTSHHVEAVVRHHTRHKVPVFISGELSIDGGTTATITNVAGRIGRADFTSGSGTGTISGNQFQNGDIAMSNGQGTIDLHVGAGRIVMIGGYLKMRLQVVAVSGGGGYAQVTGSVGRLKALAPIGSLGINHFTGSLTIPSAAASAELGY